MDKKSDGEDSLRIGKSRSNASQMLTLEVNNNPESLNGSEDSIPSAQSISPSAQSISSSAQSISSSAQPTSPLPPMNVEYDSGLLRKSTSAFRRNRQTSEGNARRRNWSAPDLSFGGSIDVSLFRLGSENSNGIDNAQKLERFAREKNPSQYMVRRASIDTTLEYIAEDEEHEQEGEDNSDRLSAEGDCAMVSPRILPPIYEQNPGSFSSHSPSSDVQVPSVELPNYRRIKSRIDTRRRKLSM